MEQQTPYSHPRWLMTLYQVAIIALIIVLVTNQCNHQRQAGIAEDLQEVLNDSLRTWKDKEGNFRAKIAVLETDNSLDFTRLATQDSTIKKLQKLVIDNKNNIKKGGSISIINTEGTVSVTVPTVVDNTNPESPIYESSFNLGKWVIGEVIASKDSTDVSLKYKDEFNLVIGREKTGFLGLGKSKPYAEITSKSPYSTVKNMRVYQNKPEANKNFHIGPGAFYGIGSEFKPQFFVGAGVMWTPINF